jgi:hypothetical protein
VEENGDERLRFVTQAKLSPWWLKLTTVSSVVKNSTKQRRSCDLSIVFPLLRSSFTVLAAAPVAKERELLWRIIVIAVHFRLILLHLDSSD